MVEDDRDDGEIAKVWRKMGNRGEFMEEMEDSRKGMEDIKRIYWITD